MINLFNSLLYEPANLLHFALRHSSWAYTANIAEDVHITHLFRQVNAGLLGASSV